MSLTCDRCGQSPGLYDHIFTDEEGQEHHWKICWDCDWEMSNGRGDEYTNMEDILECRVEEEDE